MSRTKPEDIAKKLREESSDLDRQASQMLEQLTIIDAIIDEYDEVIDRVDPKTLPLTQEINNAIQSVANAYDTRISSGCRSNLIWQRQTSVPAWRGRGGGFGNVETWRVVKDASQFRSIGFYGVKYYRKPQNREYGANIVTEIPDASVDINTKVLVIHNAGLTGLVGVTTGDFVTDDLDEPQVWPGGNLPRVTGIGTTSYYESTFSFSGFCTAFDNKIYSDGSVGVLTSANIGDRVFIPDLAIFAPNTVITGFGTADYNREFVESSGITSSVTVTISFATLNQNTIGGGTSLSFRVGIVSTFTSIFLSTITSVGAARSSFVVVRPPNVTDISFESTKNPIDPIEIGIVNAGKIGGGHKLTLINNKEPNIIAQWREVVGDPEPAVGAGSAFYYVGNFSWPTITRCTQSGAGGAGGAGGSVCTTVYAPEGTTVTISTGSTLPQSQLSYASTSPSITGNCSTIDANITAAENFMNAKISQNVPRINHYIDGAESLRKLRDEQETTAWSMLQGIAYLQDKKRSYEKNARSIEQYNWKEFGY